MKLTLDMMRDVVTRKNDSLQGHPFTIQEKGEHGIVVFNYAYAHPTLFDGPDGELLRECRGLIFSESGELLSRPYHKFFNVGEHPESKLDVLPFQDRHFILEKMDGSMIRPLFLDKGLVFASKAGPTEVSAQVDDWTKSRDNYRVFSRHMLARGWTPIFEWCSRRMRIVIDYPVDRLVLTGIRVNETGEYLPYETMCQWAATDGIEVVKAYDLDIASDVSAFVDHVKTLDDLEGYVLRWCEQGLMAKIKADEYLRFHRSLDVVKSEKKLMAIIMDGTLDDITSTMMGQGDGTMMLRDQDKEAVLSFQDKVLSSMQVLADELARLVSVEYDALRITSSRDPAAAKKEFAAVAKGHRCQGILFKLWAAIEKGQDGDLPDLAFELMKNTVAQKVGRLDEVRYLFGDLNWGDYHAGLNPETIEED